MKTQFVRAENYIPALDDRLPAFGVQLEDREVRVIFSTGTPVKAQVHILEELRARFLFTLFNHARIASVVTHMLQHFVVVGHLRHNKFTRQWVWLGDS